MFTFSKVNLPITTDIVELILHFRGLDVEMGCGRIPIEHITEKTVATFEKYCQDLIRFQHFQSHKGCVAVVLCMGSH